MKRPFAFCLVISTILFFRYASAQVERKQSTDELPQGDVLCIPGQPSLSKDCLVLGPSSYSNRMAKFGITFPMSPLPAIKPDPSLTYIDIRYGRVVTPNAPVYGSLEAAVNHKKSEAIRHIDSPYAFISYTDEMIVNNKRFYMVEYGGWMTAGDISRIGAPSTFQGLVFRKTPARPFGWILYPVQAKRTPGFQNQDYVERQYNRYDVVQIFDTIHLDNMDWYMVAPDLWIPEKQEWQRLVGRVFPNTIPPQGVDNQRWIEINLQEQTLAVYDQGELVFATLVSTGIEPFWTRPGLFQIYEKYETTPMRGAFEPDRSDAYYLEDVPWTMYFDKARALHGAYWHNGFGYPRSHGCVNMSIGDAHWLYNWAQIGDWVYVWDPSGKTPIDPAMYGEGGY